MNETEKWPADFRISETPIFLTRAFTDEATGAAKTIVVACARRSLPAMRIAIPDGLEVPNETPHPNFLVVDFGICEEDGRLTPRLIELQAFPSLMPSSCFSSAAFAKRIRRSRAIGRRRSVD